MEISSEYSDSEWFNESWVSTLPPTPLEEKVQKCYYQFVCHQCETEGSIGFSIKGSSDGTVSGEVTGEIRWKS